MYQQTWLLAMHLCQKCRIFAFLRRFCLKLNKKNQKRHKALFRESLYIDKLKIITKYGRGSRGSSCLTKTFIDVF